MSIPDYQTLMFPVLKISEDGNTHKFRDAIEILAEGFSLTDEERRELLPSGSQAVFDNRVGWARSYLKQAGLLDSPKRGFFKITERGRELLNSGITKIDNSVLEQFEEFQEFKNRKKKKDDTKSDDSIESSIDSDQTPEDQIASAYRTIKAGIQKEILENIMNSSPAFFERLVIDLIVRMGYGGSRSDAGRAIGKSGDGGIDGIINEDKLGLDVIYIQAKRWEGNVGRPEIQKFAGALQGQRARKGIFITTSNFSNQALEYVSMIESKIILIDGDRLSSLMFEHSVGVSTAGIYELKKIDSDYFEEN
ncbi:restriction endonuclease [Kiritimatiellaeota bacterium B1221]|nr:restriction endonuclease [Kiritimatiellaeota bacterium B1221]